MKRLTTDDSNSILYGLNLFFVKDGEVWIKGGGPEPDYQDCTLVDYIGRVAETHHLDIVSRDAEHLGDEMYDCLQYGTDELEGVVALLHTAAIQAAEMRGRLADIEDILGDTYDIDRLRELVEAEREGRIVVLPCKLGDSVWYITSTTEICHGVLVGVWLNYYTRPITWIEVKYVSKLTGEHTVKSRIDLMLGKTVFLTREAAEAALKGEQDGKR